MKSDILIIGGGAAGLMAAAAAADSGLIVTIVEKNLECGRKILLTGKGRCNLTNSAEWDDFAEHIHPDSNFFKNAFYQFSNSDVISFFEEAGMKTVVERGMRVFPASGKSSDVLGTLRRVVVGKNVVIINNTEVISINIDSDGSLCADTIVNEHSKSGKFLLHPLPIFARSIILATGGLSYPSTGSTGDGLRIASKMGHKIVGPLPSLTALFPFGYDFRLQGITLKNIRVDLIVNDKVVQSENGELTFTDNGIEGALGFRVSRRAVMALTDHQKVELLIDLKPALSEEMLKARLERNNMFDMPIRNILSDMLPFPVINPFIQSNPGLNVKSLPSKLKNWKFTIKGFTGYERAVITNGGISLDEISRKTMESKIVPGLFFAGEIMDLDGDTGGFNLQIAFSTGHLAAISAVEKLKNGKVDNSVSVP